MAISERRNYFKLLRYLDESDLLDFGLAFLKLFEVQKHFCTCMKQHHVGESS